MSTVLACEVLTPVTMSHTPLSKLRNASFSSLFRAPCRLLATALCAAGTLAAVGASETLAHADVPPAPIADTVDAPETIAIELRTESPDAHFSVVAGEAVVGTCEGPCTLRLPRGHYRVRASERGDDDAVSAEITGAMRLDFTPRDTTWRTVSIATTTLSAIAALTSGYVLFINSFDLGCHDDGAAVSTAKCQQDQADRRHLAAPILGASVLALGFSIYGISAGARAATLAPPSSAAPASDTREPRETPMRVMLVPRDGGAMLGLIGAF